MVPFTTQQIDAAIEAQWNAIPCHVPWKEYLASHKEREAILEGQRKCMLAALMAAQEAA